MKALLAALASVLIVGPALAQATPPASPSPASPPTSTNEGQTAPASARDTTGPGRGAYIKMQGPSGSEITVRCADGESTRACADVVMQLVERARSMSAERRRDWDRDGRGGNEWRRERDRD